MKSLLVKQIATLWEGADGSRAHVVHQGGTLDADERWKKVDALLHPAKRVCTFLIDQNGDERVFPFAELAWLLPDKTGVLVIFKQGSYTDTDGNDIFPTPNNAAIYNADGSLRCQVHFAGTPVMSADYIIERPFTRTITHTTLPIGRRGEPIDPPIVQFGVLVGTKEHPPESFFVLNTETGELTDGLFTVPY